MALANGDIVSPHLAATNVDPQPQPPKFGIVNDDGSGVDVLWEDGKLVSTIAANSLDKIEPKSADTWSGKRVMVDRTGGTGQASADYQGIVLSVHKRDQADAGSPTGDLALVKLISTGAYLEVPVSQLSVVSGGA